jgi:RNA-directed DNA polymerase
MMNVHTLIAPSSLAMCFADVRRRSAAPGIDGVTPASFEADLDERLQVLSAALGDGTWRPSALVRLRQPKPHGGVRRLAIPTVEDRVVIEMLRRALEPAIESRLSRAAYAYRPRRSARIAVDKLAGEIEAGARWVALADIREFFDSILLDHLSSGLDGLECPPQLRMILDRLLNRHALQPGRGLAQGSALSPALSNLALTGLDEALIEAGHGLIRYCDNLCVPSSSEDLSRRALAAIEHEAARLGLQLKPGESRTLPTAEGFVWLGFWFGREGRRVSDRAVAVLRQRLDAVDGDAPGLDVRERLRPIIRGWVQYFSADLPESAVLGRHDALARELLAEYRPTSGEPARESDPLVDPWDDADDLETPSSGESSRPELSDLLMEADRLAASGSYAAAEALYSRALELNSAPPSVDTRPEPEISWDEEAIDSFLGLFCAGQDMHEVAVGRGQAGPRDFSAVERPPGPRDLRAHLAGELALAIRPRLRDGTCAVAVVDVDGHGPETEIAVRAHVEALASVARAWGLEALVELTGGRGMHLWIPFERRVSADEAAVLLDALVDAAGRPAEGIRVERLPGGDGSPDLHTQAMTLPLGVHAETGRRSELRWVGGPPIGPDLAGLFAGHANDPSALVPLRARPALRRPPAPVGEEAGAPREGGRAWAELGAAPARVMRGCVILRHLAEKAVSTGHLDHSERLSLLYSVGQLGDPGKRAVHAVIRACADYSESETARQIDRLSGLPISCHRLREKHLTEAISPLCVCEFGAIRQRGGYPSPVLHGGSFHRVWRDELRRRRTREALHAESPPAGVAVSLEPGPHDTGIAVDRVPPHEWA